VYVGAILVLFLFVIMLLNLGAPGTADRIDARMFARPNTLLIGLVAAALLGVAVLAVRRSDVAAADKPLPDAGIDDISALAGEMFGRYLLPFEAVSILLLATAVAVVVLAKRGRPRTGGRA